VSIFQPSSLNNLNLQFSASILCSSISLALPTFAVLTINQEWKYNMDVFGIVYKPWRFFLLICGLPNLICALVLIFFIPESPKFTFSQGDEVKTLRIFRKIYQMNTGKSAKSFEVSGIINNEEFNESSSSQSQGFFKFMWTQTRPLFTGKHLRNILTACFIQFAVCNTSNGFWTFLPEFMNKISLWTQNQKGPATICEIFTSTYLVSNQTSTEMTLHCVEKLELDTYIYVFVTVITYGICYAILSLIINWTGKLTIILAVASSTGTSAFLLMFVKLPVIAPFMYVHMLLAGLTISVINASTVELFPTKMRAMAVCISMMVGRIGSVVGSVVIGQVIDNYCKLTFLMPVTLLFTSGLLAITIPNISKRIK
jgi:MFS transporter, VNT family, synaptic vesicle glycoprotein 2